MSVGLSEIILFKLLTLIVFQTISLLQSCLSDLQHPRAVANSQQKSTRETTNNIHTYPMINAAISVSVFSSSPASRVRIWNVHCSKLPFEKPDQKKKSQFEIRIWKLHVAPGFHYQHQWKKIKSQFRSCLSCQSEKGILPHHESRG